MVLFYLFSDMIIERIQRHVTEENAIEEIRMRVDKPLMIKTCSDNIICDYVISAKDIRDTLEMATNHSVYAYEEEIKNGYITVEGGHRIGICGKAVYENDKIQTIRNISSLNIRVAHEVPGCSERIVSELYKEMRVYNTLIISPPGCGKTTFIRDVIRHISDEGINVSVIDERSEIASCYQGSAQNNVGRCTDIMDSCPKRFGMMMLVRSMAPDVIAIDELGGINDINAMEYALNSGCSIIATIHGNSISQLRQKVYLHSLLNNKWMDRYVVITKKNGTRLYELYNREMELINSIGG